MLTIFSTPKPFRGREAVIQRNALKSWRLLGPDVEVVLFGDEEGTAEVSRELRLRHEAAVLRSEHGTKYLNDLFERAQQVGRHDLFCYANCDIMLMDDFRLAVARAAAWRRRFLMIGQRWDIDVDEPWAFDGPNWEARLRRLVRERGRKRPAEWIDYFVFRRGTFPDMPPFVIGRPSWDHWLVWKAASGGIPVLDATASVLAVHQNHDYSYHPDGVDGVWKGEEARRNEQLLGGPNRRRTIANAGFVLEEGRIRRAWGRPYRQARLKVWRRDLQAWTRPMRHAVGLRKANLQRARAGLCRIFGRAGARERAPRFEERHGE